MQSNKQITDTSKATVKQAILDNQDNVNALRSSNSGTSFPSDPIAGMHCYRTDTKKMYMYDGSNWVEEVDSNNNQQIGGTKTFTGMLDIKNYSPDTYTTPMAVQCPKLSAGQGVYINLGKEGSQYNRYSFGFHFVGDHSTSNYFSFSSYSGPSYNFDCAGNANFPRSLTAPIVNADTLNVSGAATVPTPNADNNSKTVATTAFVKTAIANLVGSAPSTLDTLQELSAALGNDANFSATVAKQIGEKVSKNGDTITGPILYDKTPNDGAELINKAYADKLAGAAGAALSEKSSALYNQLYLPRYNLYIRSALPTSAKTSITINPMALTINGSTYELKDVETLSLNSSSSWDSATYATASNRAGKDFYIYACQPSSGTVPSLILSANGTVPTGYTATNSRKIGGFHCECLDVGAVTDENPMNGYSTGDIIPFSIWDLKHRPKSSPEGMVYVEPLNVWISIYLMSWDGSKLVSAYNGVQADGTSAKPFSGTEFAEYLAKVSMRLPRYDEFVVFAKGIQECVNVKGSADVNTTGGHYTTDNKRIVSSYGIEDCAGVIWQWLSDVFGSDFTNSWNTSSNRDARNTRGDCWGGGLRRALAGGWWGDGASCGSRASDVGFWSAYASGGVACRGASEPLITDY